MSCGSEAFSGCSVLAATPVNHNYNGKERWEQWCRKSRSDNYNARDKIMGTRCTLPIISCISLWLTHPRTSYSRWQPAITGHICEIQNELIRWQRWGLWSVFALRTCLPACMVLSNAKKYLPLASRLPCEIGSAWRYRCGMKRRGCKHSSLSCLLRIGCHHASQSSIWEGIKLVLCIVGIRHWMNIVIRCRPFTCFTV